MENGQAFSSNDEKRKTIIWKASDYEVQNKIQIMLYDW